MNNSATVGIASTPVIDPINRTLDLIAYTLVGSVPTYTLHALNLGDLTDKIGPVTVATSNHLSNGDPVNFNAQYQRQRPALLNANGAIYAGFGAFCDFKLGAPRGWLLGWNANTLTPFTVNRLNDTLPSSPDGYFLSSIWMSGAGPAADGYGGLYFSTGNSDFSGTTYDPVKNISNTVAKVSVDLTQLLSKFTPSNVAMLDQEDADFGSGGVLLVPNRSGPVPRLAVAGGKDGNMGLLNRDVLGSLLDVKQIGSCWCAPSYFTGPDGIGRVVSSGSSGVGDNPYNAAAIAVWKLQTSPAPKLVLEGAAAAVVSGQDGGTFTVVSSNGTQAGTGIIWTVGLRSLPLLIKRLSYSTLSRPRQIVESLYLFLRGCRVIGHTPVATRISFRSSPMEKCLWQPGEHWLSLASTRLRLRPIRSRLSLQCRPPDLVRQAPLRFRTKSPGHSWRSKDRPSRSKPVLTKP